MDNEAQVAKAKMSGYLQMKVKKRMMSSWKSYWFVLEDRLLLYYRSKNEYEAISPCKGSIGLGPPCAVKALAPVHNGFQIESRANTYNLRADNPDEQKKWMTLLLSSLNQNQNFGPPSSTRLNHFRYSLDNLVPKVEPNDPKGSFQRQYSLPREAKDNELIQRLQKMGAHSYGGSFKTINKMKPKKIGGSHESLAGDEYLRKRIESHIYERITEHPPERVSFLVDNENYSVPLRKSSETERNTASVLHQRETKSLMMENDQYGATRHVQSDETLYAEPRFQKIIDCNKNSVVRENSFYGCADVAKPQKTENIYEDLDELRHYSRPILSGSSSQSSVEKNKEKCATNPIPLKKSKSFIKSVWKKKKKASKEEVDLYAEVDNTAMEKLIVGDVGAVQMLSELQEILEKHKTKLKAKTSNTSTEQQQSVDTDPCPVLPPKTHKSQDLSKQPLEQMRSLDEILEDLDKEKLEVKGKVQMLIEKFNEPEDVVLRKHDKFERNQRHSDDLNQLLDELAKVTSAPILTPGVTSSLVNPNLTDEEWLKLLPVRQRRLSEPDYDVPRPHQSLQLPPTPQADVIPATRFFGPVLPTDHLSSKEESLPASMTPDSLEVEEQPKCDTHYSYTSHHYNPLDFTVYNCDEKVIYALPKSYMSVATHIVNTCQNIGAPTDESTVVYKSVKNLDMQEVFKDSLELCNETTTEF